LRLLFSGLSGLCGLVDSRCGLSTWMLLNLCLDHC